MCWKCGKDIDSSMTITRDTVCETCGADIRSCKNCRFFDPGSHYDCHETVDELVKDKERANFCDSFKAKQSFAGNKGGINNFSKDTAKAKDAFAKLFGD